MRNTSFDLCNLYQKFFGYKTKLSTIPLLRINPSSTHVQILSKGFGFTAKAFITHRGEPAHKNPWKLMNMDLQQWEIWNSCSLGTSSVSKLIILSWSKYFQHNKFAPKKKKKGISYNFCKEFPILQLFLNRSYNGELPILKCFFLFVRFYTHAPFAWNSVNTGLHILWGSLFWLCR